MLDTVKEKIKGTKPILVMHEVGSSKVLASLAKLLEIFSKSTVALHIDGIYFIKLLRDLTTIKRPINYQSLSKWNFNKCKSKTIITPVQRLILS
jgi:hypothetical protein